MTAQYAMDELEDAYDVLKEDSKRPSPVRFASIEENEKLTKSKNIKQIVERFEAIGASLFSFHSNGEIMFKKYGAMIKLRPPDEYNFGKKETEI